ncbi:MAG TPA: NAD(P)-dependent oxidoreductase [Verrucomicrobiae bacterium]|nr:NAD(P)-dependent oxidoreductase [Verrucomicrobiae bacterium]
MIDPTDPLLVTGAAGFIGARVVRNLIERGFRRIRCFTRRSDQTMRNNAAGWRDAPGVEVIHGNLLSPEDCGRAAANVGLIYHLAAGRGEKSFPDAFMNSVVTTRNLLEAARHHQCLKRFVNISSFATYTNKDKPQGRLLDETCPIEQRPELRGDAYCFAKVKQDELVIDYGKRFGLPYVIVRSGYVYGPGNPGISGRVGIDTFGIFLHLGGSNPVPLSYVDNCAEAIVLAGLTPGVDGEVFNVVDDDLPSSRQFLRLYKQNVGRFRSIYVPSLASWLLCYLWERYSKWSQGQLPPVFNRRRWHAEWKGSRYSNAKLKQRLGWNPKVGVDEGLRLHFEACREKKRHA